jgi:hypothetical protein
MEYILTLTKVLPINLRTVSAGLIVPFAYMNTQYFHHTHPPSSFSYAFYPSTGTNPYKESILPSCPPFLKKRHFCLFKVYLERVSLWHFHVYMYCIPNWFIPSIAPFYLSHLLMVISAGSKILYSFL